MRARFLSLAALLINACASPVIDPPIDDENPRRPPPPEDLRPVLTVSLDGEGRVTSLPAGIDCPGACSANFEDGAAVVLTAENGATSTFLQFDGDCSGGSPCAFLMNGDADVIARFSSPPAHRVTVIVSGNGSGTITSAPASIDCGDVCAADFAEGPVTLTASAAPGSLFVGFSGACSGSSPCTLALTEDVTIYADFNALENPPPPPSDGWPKRIGGDDDFFADIGRDVEIDPRGDVFVAGEFVGLVDLGTGAVTSAQSDDGTPSRDIFLAKYAKTGEALWTRTFGSGSNADTPFGGMAVDKEGKIALCGFFERTMDLGNGVVLTATSASDGFVAVFDNDGTALWARNFGGQFAGELANQVAFDVDDNVLVTGGFGDTSGVDFGAGFVFATQSGESLDPYVVKLDGHSGNTLWAKHLRDLGPSGAEGMGIGSDGEGNVYITTYFKTSIVIDGVAHTNNHDGADILVAKLNGADGARVWSKNLGIHSDVTSPWAIPRAGLAVDSQARSVFVAGEFRGSMAFGGQTLTSANGNFDIFILRFGGDGAELAFNHYPGGGSNQMSAHDIDVDPAGNVVLAGDFFGTSDFGGGETHTASGRAAWVAKYSGGLLGVIYSFTYGGGDDAALGIAVDGEDTLAVTGMFDHSTNFDGTTLTATGGDAFVVYLTADEQP